MYDKTMTFSVNDEKEIEMKKTLMLVYDALTKKGYNPVNQIVGYILSEDPTYTDHDITDSFRNISGFHISNKVNVFALF